MKKIVKSDSTGITAQDIKNEVIEHHKWENFLFLGSVTGAIELSGRVLKNPPSWLQDSRIRSIFYISSIISFVVSGFRYQCQNKFIAQLNQIIQGNTEALTYDQIETLRKNPTFRPFIEKLSAKLSDEQKNPPQNTGTGHLSQGKISTEIETITLNTSAMDSPYWKFVSKEFVNPTEPNEGSILTFEFKETSLFKTDPNRFEEFTKKVNSEMFPALEDYPIKEIKNPSRALMNVIRFIDDYTRQDELLSLAKKLGYKYEFRDESYYLSLPDRKALLSGWNKYRKVDVNISELKIVYSNGIATDEEFIEAFFRDEVIISAEKEFIHDQTAHVIALISHRLEHKRHYPEFKKGINNLINLFYIPLKWHKENEFSLCSDVKKNYEILMAIIGMKVDNLNAENPCLLNNTLTKLMLYGQFQHLYEPFTSDSRKKYFKERFSLSSLDSIEKCWDQMLSSYYANKLGFDDEQIKSVLKSPFRTAITLFRLTQSDRYDQEKIAQYIKILNEKDSIHKIHGD